MRRIKVLALLVLLAAGTAIADPALGGGRGLFRVQDARVEEDGALVFANRWMWSRQPTIHESMLYFGPLYGFEISYAPFPVLEMFGSLAGVLSYETDVNSLKYDWQGQILGAKLSIPFLPVLKLAGSAHYAMEKADHSRPGYMEGLANKGAYWRAIGALRLWDIYKTLPTLMINYGQGFSDDVPRFAGIGVEMASDAIDLFIEATSEPVAGGGFLDGTAKARITPGVRVKIPYFHLNGGVEIGLTDSVPDYQAIVGFSFVSPFPKPKPRPWGRLAGKVKDARSGLPLEATISSPNRKFRKMTTDSETGIFFLQKAPTGVIVVEASADGYIPEAVPLVITDQGYATYTFELKPLVPYGTVAGRVYDKYTGKPMAAEIRFPESDIAAVQANERTGFFRTDRVPAGLVGVEAAQPGYFTEQRLVEVEDGGVTRLEFALVAENMKGWFAGKVSDRKTGTPLAATVTFTSVQRPALGTNPATGTFAAELPVGSFDVKVEAEGYLPQTATFAISKGDSTVRNFEMVQKGMVLTLRGVYFEFGKATLRPESFIALNDAAQILKDNPDIRVEIQGHTDSIGSAQGNLTLSERRAYSVVNYLVQYGGIDAQRLVAKGYGLTQPVASNNTEEGRALNRRVDFVILK